MCGIKDLTGLLFWMDNDNLSTMKAVSNGQRKLSNQKKDILESVRQALIISNEADQATKPGAGPKTMDNRRTSF